MVNYLEYVETRQVIDADSFGLFVQQRTGTPLPTHKEKAILLRNAKVIFKQYPKANWQTFVHTVEYCINNKKRYATCYGYLNAVKYAWLRGYLPELDPTPAVDEKLERRIEVALRTEQDEVWRGILLYSVGIKARAEMYEAWWKERGPRGGS